MHVIDSGGDNPPLVLLHAFPVDSRMWTAAGDPLAERFRVITPDQRGLGATPLDEGGRVPPPDLSVVARDVIGLLDELELDRVVLGGLSMGGYVAMALLAAAPHRVAGLVLADTRAAADGPEQRATRQAVAERAETADTMDWLADSMLPNVLGATTRSDRRELVTAVRGLIMGQPPEGVAWAQRAMAARPDNSALVRATEVPTLVVVGEEDTLTPPATARELADAMPHADLTVLPSAGHLSALEVPDSFAATLLGWWARSSGGASGYGHME
ncbi:alpha/beta hydrolase [Longimycelium tulufanense]|uniref:Alpha/beta hydrolase n=1 Tax=Longimycelium tulufanense TaxID=907463 RepID=A0A8J3C5Y5_9PSEU|nr:alpha/beta fold hydrolase [Longimycelium tulufanense]GGM35491.1 alpha/beta hydrolase [Longimycelium tulufanense]